MHMDEVDKSSFCNIVTRRQVEYRMQSPISKVVSVSFITFATALVRFALQSENVCDIRHSVLVRNGVMFRMRWELAMNYRSEAGARPAHPGIFILARPEGPSLAVSEFDLVT